MKLKNKKQLIKIADAARLLHADYKWMWVSTCGRVRLSKFKPEEHEEYGYVGIKADLACVTRIDRCIPVKDTLVQLHGD